MTPVTRYWNAMWSIVGSICFCVTTVFCFVLVVHESLVCSEQLNWALFFRKILHVLQILQFSSIFCIFEPFPAVTVWFWDPSFHTEDNWGTQTQLLKKFKRSLMLQKETRCIKSRGSENFWIEDQGKLYLICLPGNMQVSSVASEGQY